MMVKIQKKILKDNSIVYRLLMNYKKEDGKFSNKSLGKSSQNLKEMENYKYRIDSKIKQNRINNLDEAIEIANEVFKEDGFMINSRIHSTTTFINYSKEVIDYKFKIKNISEKTYNSYLTALNHLINFFGNIKVSDIKTRMINDYIAIKSSEISTSTLDQHLTVLGIVIKSALRDDILNKDIMVGIEKPKKSKKETYIYSEEEVGMLIKTLKKNGSKELNLRVQLILKLGLRNSEVLGLCWDAIDFKKQLIHIHRITTIIKEKNQFDKLVNKVVLEDRAKTKTSDRVLRLSNQLTEELKEYKKYQLANNIYDNQLLFCKNDKPISEDVFSREFKKYLKDNNLPETTLHGLRHFYGSLLIKNHRPITEVAKNMGHSSPTITSSIYIHELDDVTKKSTELMDDLYANIF
ncbi:tyrosine-type recombinase/integrase [Peptacetobacter sp. AB800]|uniref:tyrosine-type recombinase/integrase n=1 Tax=Peptacetobacter sp. AB800 TaxID=3388428 RepID=UPI0039FDAEE2